MKYYRIPFLVLLFLAFIKANYIYAEENYSTIAGSLKEEVSGESVIGATIAIYKDSIIIGKSALRGAISNKFGFYSIPKVKNGNYYLVAKGIGLETNIQKINVNESSNHIINIKLKIKSTTTKEVVVEAYKDDNKTSGISSITVSPQLISKMPSIGGETDIFRALQLLPGVKQASEISSGLYVRGGSPDQNLILLDGVSIYNPSHLGGFLSAFNTDAIRDIKLIKGAFPAEYGGRMSSVLDMTMKDGTKEKFTGVGGISLLSSHLTLEGPINDKSTFMISGRRMYLDLFTALASKSGSVPQYYFYDFNAKINYELSSSDKIFLSGYLGKDALNSTANARNNFNIDWGNSTANARWLHIFSPEVITNLSLIYTKYNFQTDLYDTANTAANFSSLSKIEDYTIRTETQYFPTENHIFKTGFEATFHTFSVNAATNLVPGIRINIVDPNSVIKTLDASYFLQDEWQITDKLSANLGGRLYYFQEGKYLNTEPRLSMSYLLSDNTSINASGAIAHQYLHLISRNDLTLPTDLWFPSTTNIKPSRSWQATLGMETKLFDGEYLFSAETYFKRMYNLYEYKDTAQFTFGIPLETQFTSGWGESYGLELFINKRIGNFTGWIGYTLSWTKRYFAELNNGNPYYPRYDIRNDISIVTTFEINKRWEFGASWVYYSGQTYTVPTGAYNFSPVGWGSQVGNENPYSSRDKQKFIYTERNGYRMAPYHKLDLNFMYKFTWFDLPFQCSINIYNAYNRLNPFAMYIDTQYDNQGNITSKQFKQITLFPFIPSFALGFKF